MRDGHEWPEWHYDATRMMWTRVCERCDLRNSSAERPGGAQIIPIDFRRHRHG